MYDYRDELKREAVQAILNRYHQTRMADDDPVDFILRDPKVNEALDELLRLYMTG